MTAGWSETLSAQLPLGLSLRRGATFENFYAAGNLEVLRILREDARDGIGQCVYIWGAEGTGKTHLLQAVCHEITTRGELCAYLPLSEASSLSPEVLDGLEEMAAVCIDDIQAIVGLAAWETKLFHLYNRMRDSNARLIVAGNANPNEIGIRLADLWSRLTWGLVLQLRPLDDAGKAAALQLHAHNRGMELPMEVAHYLLRRCPRDMTALYAILDQLDVGSLAAQRKLTIPFVKTVLDRE